MTEIAEAVDMMVSDEIEAQERAGNANPGWERAFANIAEEVARRNAAPANGTVAALTADMVAAGGTLPYPGTGSDASATPAVPNSQVIHDLDRRVLQAQTDGYPQSRDIEREQSAALPRLACAGCSGREAPMTRPRPGTGMSIRRANALDSQGGMARLMDMTMTRRCLVCGDKKSGCTDYCRTHKFAVRAGARRVTEEGLIVDLAGGSWWVWDARGFVLVIGQDTKPKALAILAAGGNVDEVDRLLAGEAS